MQEVTDRMWDSLSCAQLELYQDESSGDDFIYWAYPVTAHPRERTTRLHPLQPPGAASCQFSRSVDSFPVTAHSFFYHSTPPWLALCIRTTAYFCYSIIPLLFLDIIFIRRRFLVICVRPNRQFFASAYSCLFLSYSFWLRRIAR